MVKSICLPNIFLGKKKKVNTFCALSRFHCSFAGSIQREIRNNVRGKSASLQAQVPKAQREAFGEYYLFSTQGSLFLDCFQVDLFLCSSGINGNKRQ